ncbi:glycosyltransferase family 2 protein [Bradyrhizobium sp. Ec3.3]|uniref:glycosyltransferase family 2 protein n=1 Tax=Bradyrhizobium sp. Ec3.3 TaxID=189753 RepID=UPI00042158AB|nr:glycosyltransferase family 2 protein [Bradyrhizobium sp. Ec3.3]
MHATTLPLFQLFAPTLCLFAVMYFLAPTLPLGRAWARVAIFVTVWLVVARYLEWRIFATVLPASGEWYEVGWIWFCLFVELLTFADQFILYLTFLRRTDRRGEADQHERRLRGLPNDALPSVDVFIPTYDEPLEVLEKTITGALCLDYPNFQVWVLDDGRRPWLRQLCEHKGAGYLTRADQANAKAGNINHALTKSNGEFFVIFDADFVPQRNFLMRTIGFFADPRIGIVQIPHTFYNEDPMQANLGLHRGLPDEQRFFFDSIMPARDGWDGAFCCGSNSVTRRAALRSVGDALPTQSITEDILLTMVLLRKGYITRYLSEPLAIGLAPESLTAFFVQRKRWARGAIQTLYLGDGPLGPGLSLMHRLLFFPTHWLSMGLRALMVVVVPIVFMWTGITPVIDVTPESVFYYLFPAILALNGGISCFAPHEHFPLAAQVSATIQSFKLLPVVLATLLKPKGHVFKVTPKGTAARRVSYASEIFWPAAILMALTVVGLVLNTIPEWRVIDHPAALPMVAFWSVVNVVVLFFVCMTSLQARMPRGEERFVIDEPILIRTATGERLSGRVKDVSLSGAGILLDCDANSLPGRGASLHVHVAQIGWIDASVMQQRGQFVGVQFALPPSLERDLLIRKLFTGAFLRKNNAVACSVNRAMLKNIWLMHTPLPSLIAGGAKPVPPAERLPAESLVIRPRPPADDWGRLAGVRSVHPTGFAEPGMGRVAGTALEAIELT